MKLKNYYIKNIIKMSDQNNIVIVKEKLTHPYIKILV